MRNILLIILLALNAFPQKATEYLGQKEGLSSNHVNCVIQDGRGFLWIGTDSGLDLYDGDAVQSFPRPVISLAECGGFIWAGTNEGVFYYNPSDGSLSPFRVTTRYGVNIIAPVNALAVNGNNLWAGTAGQGIFIYNLSTQELVQHSIHTPYVKRITQDADGRIIVECLDGSTYLYSHTGDYIRDVNIHLANNGASLLDREGTLWIPTEDMGLMIIPRKDAGTVSTPLPEGNLPGRTTPITEDDEGTLWMGIGNRLYTLSPEGHEITVEKGANISGNISQLLYVPGYIWIGTEEDGLYRYAPAQKRVTHYPLATSVTAIQRLSGGDIIVGTDLGVFSYRTDTDSFVPELNRKDIRIILNGDESENRNLVEFEVVAKSSVAAFAEDISYHLYMATSNRGLFRKDLIGGRWEHLVNTRTGDNYLSGNKVTTLFPGKDGGIWAGTAGDGLWYLPKDSLSFSRHALPDRRLDGAGITSLATDGIGRLWMSTTLGLWCFDNSRHSITPYNIRSGKLLYSKSGKLYVGQSDAIVSLIPGEAGAGAGNSNVVIREMHVGDSTLFIPPGGRDIVLKYSQNSFSIRLAELSYTAPSRKVYSWRLRGLEKNWTRGSSQNMATYTKIPYGDYVFEAGGCDDILHITVSPPWWRSTAASILWVILGMGALAAAMILWQRSIKRRYSKLMKEREEAREKELYKQRLRFFIGLVHEIRTPLTLIRLQHDKEEHEPDDTISRNLNYMQDTINRILSYDKNTSDGIDMLVTRVDLNALVEAVASNFRESAISKGLRLMTAPYAERVFVYADEDQITKILNNLLSNALKYTRDSIVVEVDASGEKAFIRVEDNGPGVKEEEREKIFGMFYTPADDKIAASSGMGVGLAYARQIAKAHNGDISVEKSAMGGASFVLSLPLMKEEEKPEEPAYSGTPADTGITVLITEDNTELLKTVQEELSSYYRILTATDGAKALTILEEEDVDIVVSDVMMPIMDGLELCRKIKGNMAYSHIPVILLTAKVSVTDKTEGMTSGADAYVEKPFSLRQLRGQIDNLIHLREAFRKAVTESGELPKEAHQGHDADFMNAINASIEKQIAEESFSIETLAYDMAMSRTNFFRKFKALTGGTPNDYLKNYRLTRAAELIREGARINEAAEKV
ncbi:MAG: response regulator [Bacteroidales bacterium]|nr:response regulator [Bacteroidales bacterium]